MRLFLAIDLPKEIKDRIEKKIQFLKNDYPQFSWVDKDNFHITLHFYGEVNSPEKIIKKLKDYFSQEESFYLYFRRGNVFVNEKIVLYLDFFRQKKLERLIEKINHVFLIKRTKKFIPHLTIARAKKPSKQQYFHLKKKITQLDFNLSFLVNEIILFQSILSGKKPLYKKVNSIILT